MSKPDIPCVRYTGVDRAILVGNAMCDAELRHTTTSKPVANVSLATN